MMQGLHLDKFGPLNESVQVMIYLTIIMFLFAAIDYLFLCFYLVLLLGTIVLYIYYFYLLVCAQVFLSSFNLYKSLNLSLRTSSSLLKVFLLKQMSSVSYLLFTLYPFREFVTTPFFVFAFYLPIQAHFSVCLYRQKLFFSFRLDSAISSISIF